MWLGLVASIDPLYLNAKQALVGAIIGYLSLWSVWWVFKQLTGKEGMGHGDFKLLAAIGAWVGLKGVLPTILLSSVVGAIIGSAWLLAKGRDRSTQIPFGPYLAVAGFAVFFWGFLWGIPGALIGVPIMLTVVAFCAEFPSSRWVATLLSGAPPGKAERS